VAWLRIMGADSVDYPPGHGAGPGRDHPGRALAYYASRGETPLLWGGAGAGLLGLQGAGDRRAVHRALRPGRRR
jgi:hypothetical protein